MKNITFWDVISCRPLAVHLQGLRIGQRRNEQGAGLSSYPEDGSYVPPKLPGISTELHGPTSQSTSTILYLNKIHIHWCSNEVGPLVMNQSDYQKENLYFWQHTKLVSFALYIYIY
jgi:hypothetical protein